MILIFHRCCLSQGSCWWLGSGMVSEDPPPLSGEISPTNSGLPRYSVYSPSICTLHGSEDLLSSSWIDLNVSHQVTYTIQILFGKEMRVVDDYPHPHHTLHCLTTSGRDFGNQPAWGTLKVAGGGWRRHRQTTSTTTNTTSITIITNISHVKDQVQYSIFSSVECFRVSLCSSLLCSSAL